MLRRRRAAQINRQSVPYGSTKVEYLESPPSGKTIINTNIFPTENVFIDADASVVSDSTVAFICGSNSYGNSTGEWITEKGIILVARLTSQFRQKIWFGMQNFAFDKYQDLEKHNWVFKNKKLIVDGELIKDFSEFQALPSVAPLILFAQANNPAINPPGMVVFDGGVNTRIFQFKMASEGEKVDFIPCLDRTGTPCMFDKVTRKKFYNSGTGDFLYPTTSTTYSLRRPQAEYAKMTDTGIRRLYHVPSDYEGSIEDYAIENGYKRLIETESPNEEGKYYSFKWVETDDTLTTEWFEVEPPQEDFFEENLDNLTE